MDHGTAAVIIAGMMFAFTVLRELFGGGVKVSQRLKSLETMIESMQAEIQKLSSVLVKMADLRGDLKETNANVTSLNARVTAVEADVREMRHGQGFVRGPGGIDREF